MAIIFAIIVTVIVAFCCYGSMKPVSNASDANDYMEGEIKLSLKTDNFLRTEKKRKDDN